MLTCFPIIKKSEFSLTIYKYVTTGNENLVRLLATHLNTNLVSSCAYNDFGFLKMFALCENLLLFFMDSFKPLGKMEVLVFN